MNDNISGYKECDKVSGYSGTNMKNYDSYKGYNSLENTDIYEAYNKFHKYKDRYRIVFSIITAIFFSNFIGLLLFGVLRNYLIKIEISVVFFIIFLLFVIRYVQESIELFKKITNHKSSFLRFSDFFSIGCFMYCFLVLIIIEWLFNFVIL